MASLDMTDESYPLTIAQIDKQVTKTRPGNYALGFIGDNDAFKVRYVGRSDDDVNERLKDHVNEDREFKKFKFLYATSAKVAFEKECVNYHDYVDTGKLKNKYHPARPKGSNWKCPVQGCSELD